MKFDNFETRKPTNYIHRKSFLYGMLGARIGVKKCQTSQPYNLELAASDVKQTSLSTLLIGTDRPLQKMCK